MQLLRQTNDMLDAAGGLRRLQASGELYESPGVVHQAREIEDAVDRLARVVAPELRNSVRDRFPELVKDDREPPKAELLYNGTVVIESPLGGGFCGYGLYDFDTMTCSYIGIGRCGGFRP